MNSLGSRREPFLFIIDFEMERAVVLKAGEVSPASILYNINGRKNYRNAPLLRKTVLFGKNPMPRSEYRKAFELVQDNLRAGNSYLANLTFPTPITSNLSLEETFFASQAPYRLCVQGQFACFSPETFITIEESGQIASYPMKGTIDAGLPEAEKLLLGNEKEKAEHATIVDLLRNDLSMVADKVRVKRYRYVEGIQTHHGGLLQSSSEIAGMLKGDFGRRLGGIIFELLPAGSVSGAPKRKTVEIIRAAEGASRGYYTGIFGLYDGRRLDSGVMIRFIEQTAGGMFFRSGGGITASSTESEEYDEMVRKVYLPFACAEEAVSR